MILGEYVGYMYYLENTGGAGNAAIFNTSVLLNEYFATQDSLAPIFEGTHAYPQLIDLDRDTDLDLVLGKRNGKLSYLENTGGVGAYVFEKTTTDLGLVDVSEYWTIEGHSIPQFIDIDNEYHLILGSKVGSLHYYDNIEGNLGGTWNLVDSTLEDINIGTFSAPAIYDITSDYRLEMVLGNKRGGLGLYKSAPMSDIGIDISEQNYDFNIYPNPATNEVTIDLGAIPYNELISIKIVIVDISGRNVKKITPNSSLIKVNTSDFASGTYLINIAGTSIVQTEKLLIE
jgi:hypothetical protein